MADSQEKRAIEIQDAIRQVLMRDWDPIGVDGVPEAADEYDSYIGDIYRILASSRSEDALIDFLTKTETETMGLGATLQHQLRFVAQKLLALDTKL